MIHVCLTQIFAGAKETLDDFLANIEPLLAEVSAIGGDFYIPPKLQGTTELQGKILIKNYVDAGSLEYLTGADHFFQEELVMMLTLPNVNLTLSNDHVIVLLTYQFCLGRCC